MHHHNIAQAIRRFKQRHDLPVCQVRDCNASTGLIINSSVTRADGTKKKYYMCRPHAAEKMRKYYARPMGRAAIFRAQIRYAERQLEKLESK